jgi:DNA-binding transcriptional MerR regulator
MEEAREDDESRRISETAKMLGLSLETIKRLVPIEIDLPSSAECSQEQGTPCYERANDALSAELRDRIALLERRLDDADAERDELLKAAAVERKKLVELILEREPRSAWPGIWPMLQRLQQRLSKSI